jgi:X-X-X-Leu-X-X-Gly heptad repeat protein
MNARGKITGNPIGMRVVCMGIIVCFCLGCCMALMTSDSDGLISGTAHAAWGPPEEIAELFDVVLLTDEDMPTAEGGSSCGRYCRASQDSADANELSDGADRLSGNTNELYDGTDSLSGYANEISDDTDRLSGNRNELSDGADRLSGNWNELSEGADWLSGNTNEIYDGTDSLSGNANEISDDADKLAGWAKKLSNGVNKLSGYVKERSDGADKSSGHEKKISNGENALSGYADWLSDNANQLSGYGNEISDGSNEHSGHANWLFDGADRLTGWAKMLSDGAYGLSGYANGLSDGAGGHFGGVFAFGGGCGLAGVLRMAGAEWAGGGMASRRSLRERPGFRAASRLEEFKRFAGKQILGFERSMPGVRGVRELRKISANRVSGHVPEGAGVPGVEVSPELEVNRVPGLEHAGPGVQGFGELPEAPEGGEPAGITDFRVLRDGRAHSDGSGTRSETDLQASGATRVSDRVKGLRGLAGPAGPVELPGPAGLTGQAGPDVELFTAVMPSGATRVSDRAKGLGGLAGPVELTGPAGLTGQVGPDVELFTAVMPSGATRVSDRAEGLRGPAGLTGKAGPDVELVTAVMPPGAEGCGDIGRVTESGQDPETAGRGPGTRWSSEVGEHEAPVQGNLSWQGSGERRGKAFFGTPVFPPAPGDISDMVVRVSGGEAFAEGYAEVEDGTVEGVVMMHGRDPVTGNGRGTTAMGFVLPGGGLAAGRLYGPDGTELARKYGGMMYRHNLAAMGGVMFAPEGEGGRRDHAGSPEPRILPERANIWDRVLTPDRVRDREQARDGGRTQVPGRDGTPVRMPVAGRVTVAFDPLCPVSRRLMASPAVSELERAGTEIVWAPVNVLQGSLGHGEFFLREGRLPESDAEASGDTRFWERADGAALAIPGIIPEGEWFGPSAVLENTWRFRSVMGAGAEPVSPVLMWTEGGALRTRTGVPLPGELDPGRMDPAGSPAAVAYVGPDAGFESVGSVGAYVSPPPFRARNADVSSEPFRARNVEVSSVSGRSVGSDASSTNFSPGGSHVLSASVQASEVADSSASVRETETDVSIVPSAGTDIVSGASAGHLVIADVTSSAPGVSGITDVSQLADQFVITNGHISGEGVLSGIMSEYGSGSYQRFPSGSVSSDHVDYDASPEDHIQSIEVDRFRSGYSATNRFSLGTSSGIPSEVPLGLNSGQNSGIPLDGSGYMRRPQDTVCAERQILASMGVRTAEGDIFEDCPALRGKAGVSGTFAGMPPETSVMSGEATLEDRQGSAAGPGSGGGRVSGDELSPSLPDTGSAGHEAMPWRGGPGSDGFENLADGGGRRSGTS